jgi:predicted nucleic acid-binding protein
MKVVAADTSPVNYLILIDCIDLLQRLYVRILIPVEVLNELAATGAPPEVAAWLRNRPAWLEVRTTPVDPSVQFTTVETELDAGELAAIRLALSEPESLLLIDEATGRSVASQLGVANTGTLGVLLAGAKEGLVDLPAALDRLQKTNFRISQALINKILSDVR